MEIRQATLHDAEVICGLNAEVQSVHAAALPHLFKPASDQVFSVDVIRELLGKPETLMLLALVDGSPAGYAYAQLIDAGETPYFRPWKRLYLHHISVDQAYQRKGIGSALLDRALAEARRQGVTTVAADFWSFNDKARALFKSAGFTPYKECVWLQLDANAAWRVPISAAVGAATRREDLQLPSMAGWSPVIRQDGSRRPSGA